MNIYLLWVLGAVLAFGYTWFANWGAGPVTTRFWDHFSAQVIVLGVLVFIYNWDPALLEF